MKMIWREKSQAVTRRLDGRRGDRGGMRSSVSWWEGTVVFLSLDESQTPYISPSALWASGPLHDKYQQGRLMFISWSMNCQRKHCKQPLNKQTHIVMRIVPYPYFSGGREHICLTQPLLNILVCSSSANEKSESNTFPSPYSDCEGTTSADGVTTVVWNKLSSQRDLSVPAPRQDVEMKELGSCERHRALPAIHG